MNGDGRFEAFCAQDIVPPSFETDACSDSLAEAAAFRASLAGFDLFAEFNAASKDLSTLQLYAPFMKK